MNNPDSLGAFQAGLEGALRGGEVHWTGRGWVWRYTSVAGHQSLISCDHETHVTAILHGEWVAHYIAEDECELIDVMREAAEIVNQVAGGTADLDGKSRMLQANAHLLQFHALDA